MKIVAETSNDNDIYRFIIERIASTLGCTIESILSKNNPDLEQTSDLLSLWISIENVQDRAKVLTYARIIAAQAPPVGAAQ